MPEIFPEANAALLKGVGPKKAAALAGAGVNTVRDLLYYFPRTYEDRRNRLKIEALKEGASAAFRGRVLSLSAKPVYYAKGKKTPLYVLVGDDTGAVEVVFFNSKYIDKILLPGREFMFFGTPQRARGRMQIVHPDFEAAPADDDGAGAGRPIIPVYALRGGLLQKDMRRWHEAALPAASAVSEYLPYSLIKNEKLRGVAWSLRNIHFPDDKDSLKEARYRFIFEELLMIQLGLLRLKPGRDAGQCGTVKSAATSADEFERLLPFKFTAAQKRAISEIYGDMENAMPMNRLVQGDVGSGKTAVAAAAVYKAVKSGYQALMMAPTEILARQHYEDLAAIFEGIIDVVLITSGMASAERRAALESCADGRTGLAVGTHALLQPDVAFKNAGLVITDEQHRFGVNQRIALARKREVEGTVSGGAGSPAAACGADGALGSGLGSPAAVACGADGSMGGGAGSPAAADGAPAAQPDVLVMTATPIPRSLAFVIYGDLDMSVIDEMPPGRRKIITRSVTSEKRKDVYSFLEGEIKKGRQCYVVAPLIEDNEDSAVTAGLRSAESLHGEISRLLPRRRVALLHGRMKQNEKDGVMAAFSAGDIDALVSTVVIEVGINVPNATVMIVENAERFGLAQLHQLRGRVGRGSEQSYCVLISDAESEDAIARAETLVNTDDGFEIAEKDLSMRGPGDLFGVRQHGIPTLHIADLVRHIRVAEKAKAAAQSLLADDPLLVKPENRALGDSVEALFRDVSEIGL